MSPLDEQFRKRLERLLRFCGKGSPKEQFADLNPDETAGFLVVMVEGYASLAKNAQDTKVWEVGIRNIVGWLKPLRAPRQSWRGGRRMLKKHVLR
jgi:TetR/AcrR family transcriptional regulator, transcriptional repressor for nem operon